MSMEGIYDVSTSTGEHGIYPPESERVVILEAFDGYYDIILLDGENQIVAENNRPRHRIEAALDGDTYNIVVRG